MEICRIWKHFSKEQFQVLLFLCSTNCIIDRFVILTSGYLRRSLIIVNSALDTSWLFSWSAMNDWISVGSSASYSANQSLTIDSAILASHSFKLLPQKFYLHSEMKRNSLFKKFSCFFFRWMSQLNGIWLQEYLLPILIIKTGFV